MRKVKAYQLLAAAVTAVPGIAFASGDETVQPLVKPQTFRDQPMAMDLSRLGFRSAALPQMGEGPDADGNFTWVGPPTVLTWPPIPPTLSQTNGQTWTVNANWTPNTGFPDGANAHAFLTNLTGGGTIRLPSSITLNTLNISDPQSPVIANPLPVVPTPTITMTGQARINLSNPATIGPVPNNLLIGGLIVGLPEDTAAGTPARPVQFGGTSGLSIDGPSAVLYTNNNVYSGNTTLTNGAMVTVNPGATLDGAFGGGAGNVVMNNGRMFINRDFDVMTRNIEVQAGGATIFTSIATVASNHEFQGVISGSGNLTVDARFAGRANFTANNTITGQVRFMGAPSNFTLADLAGTFQISGNGAFTSANRIVNAATLELIGSGANVNRLPDAAPLDMVGSALRMHNQGLPTMTETVGPMNLTGGTSAIVVRNDGDVNTVLNTGNMTVGSLAGLEIRGNRLGGATGLPGSGTTTVNISNGTSLLQNGILKFAYVNPFDSFTTGIEDPNTELATYTAAGVTPLSATAAGYLEDTFAGSNAATNVRFKADSNPNANLGGATVNMNSLVLAGGFGPAVTVSNGTANITSGVILSAGQPPSGSGNFLAAGTTINFGATEIVLQTPAALTSNALITGTGGLRKIGLRTLFMNNTQSTFTGPVKLTGFNRHMGDLLLGQPSAFGAGLEPIELIPSSRSQIDPGLGFTTAEDAVFAMDMGQTTDTTMTRGMIVRDGGLEGYTGGVIRNFSIGFTFHMNGPIMIEDDASLTFQPFAANDLFSVGGVVSGLGKMRVEKAADAAGYTLTINGNNTFSGGFDWSGGGSINVGNNNAFGTGPITIQTFRAGTAPIAGSNHNFVATGGPRTIANDLIMDSGFLSIFGSNDVTFTGNVFANGAVLEVAAGRTATLSGSVRDASLIKIGDGNAVLSGNNTFNGNLQLGGLLTSTTFATGGVVSLNSNNAAGTTVGATLVVGTGGALELNNGVQIGDEEMDLFNADGIADAGGMRGRGVTPTTWGGRVFVLPLYSGEGGGSPPTLVGQRSSIGVDAGSTMNISRSISTFDTGGVQGTGAGATLVFLANSIGVRKVGGGELVVGRDTFNNQTGGGNFQGSVLASGSIDIQGGTLRFSNAAADSHVPSVATASSLSIAGGPGAATAKLDIGKNSMVIDYTGSSPLNDIRQFVAQGAAAVGSPPTPTWTGNGITSSDGTGPNQGFGVGYADNIGGPFTGGGVNYTTFNGKPVDNTSVLIAWTRYGDGDLNGIVNLADFNRLAANFGLAAGAVWGQGDFDYNGNVNLADFNRVAANFGLPPAGPDGPTPQDWAGLAAAVPEPATLGLVAVAGLGLLRRRRRNA